MYKADPTAYCGYNAGYGIPDQVKSAAGHDDTVRINFTTSVNPNWLLGSYLSEITPMPDSWDRSSGSQASTWRERSLRRREHRRGVQRRGDVPHEGRINDIHLHRKPLAGRRRRSVAPHCFSSAGNATFQPNAKYQGPRKAQVRFVKEVAYTTVQSEESALLNSGLSIGYIDPSVLTSPAPAPGRVGPNWVPLASHYSLVSGSSWSFNYAAFNFTSSDPNGATVDQLYIRQALQYAVDQRSIIESADKGYGSAIDSPLPRVRRVHSANQSPIPTRSTSRPLALCSARTAGRW